MSGCKLQFGCAGKRFLMHIELFVLGLTWTAMWAECNGQSCFLSVYKLTTQHIKYCDIICDQSVNVVFKFQTVQIK